MTGLTATETAESYQKKNAGIENMVVEMVRPSKPLKHTVGFDLASVEPEYSRLKFDMPKLRKLFQLKYMEHISDPALLSELVGCHNAEELSQLERTLYLWLCKVMNGSFRADLLELICPNCLLPTVTAYGKGGEEIKPTCFCCGVEANEFYNDGDGFDQSLDRDVTYAPSSQISWTRGLGGTFDPKKDFLKLLEDRNSCLLSEFEKEHAFIAAQFEHNKSFLVCADNSARTLLPENEVVVCGDKAYRKMGEHIRWINLSELYWALDSAFHANDVHLRKKKTTLASSTPNGLEKALGYAMQLCGQYGFNDKDRDQPFFNTVGNEVRSMKQQLKAQKRHIPEKRMVETIFYICLLRFDRKTIAAVAATELNIDFDLIKHYNDYKEFLRAHDPINASGTLLNTLEQAPNPTS